MASARSDVQFFMCAPRFYGVEYVINPWMEGNVGRVDRAAARAQWQALHDALAGHAPVEIIPPVEGLPDMPFAANAGLVYDDTYIPARFRFPQRAAEVAHYRAWFERRGYRVVELPDGGSFEGEGDALLQPDEPLLWAGYGVRSSLDVYRPLAERLGLEIVPLRLIDERFYHLDTCFCPLDEGRVLYYPEAFDSASLHVLRARVPPERRLEVTTRDALGFACNAIVVGRTVLTNAASGALRERLRAWGYAVAICPLGEFLLAGGSAKCLVLRRTSPPARRTDVPATSVCEAVVEVQGHLLDRGLFNRTLDAIADAGGSFSIDAFQPGLRHDQGSVARVRVVAPAPSRLEAILGRLMPLGARVVDGERDARLEPVGRPGVAPADFYSTTIYPTEVRIDGHWVRARQQRMDAVLVVTESADQRRVECRLLRDLAPGDRVVCGVDGVRITPPPAGKPADAFRFMDAGVSSERRVELAVERIAWEMRRIRERGGRIVVVPGPVVVHTGGAPHLARLVEHGYVQALLAGNGFATHDIEHALFGTSLGVDLARGTPVTGGHRHHLRAINTMRACGGIAHAVREGVLRGGVMRACVVHRVPFVLAGSIRDDGPLPETIMDLVAAQAEYARLIAGADMILLLGSMLHAIGVGNMTPGGVRLVCVDISPAVVTKLADRGSLESTGIVTDVGLFLNLLDAHLTQAIERDEPHPRADAER
jgi:lysine-ketoglutarate reductase/saccharopine dehydrogenase-like protein (TIGR00300 family)